MMIEIDIFPDGYGTYDTNSYRMELQGYVPVNLPRLGLNKWYLCCRYYFYVWLGA